MFLYVRVRQSDLPGCSQVSKTIAAAEKEIQEDEEIEGPPKKLPKYVDDEEGLEVSRMDRLRGELFRDIPE